MPIEVSIHPGRSLGYFKFRGDTDVAEGVRAFLEYVDHPLFDPTFTMLSNTAHLGEVKAGFRGILMGIQRLAPQYKRFRFAADSVIYARDDVAFGTARMLQQMLEPISQFRFHIQRTEQEALGRAGQPETGFDALDAALLAERAANPLARLRLAAGL
ncbi:hypothetical protein [Tropicibacter naphthalenivorans]|uniref:Uncharacterized protein n=1 Tax=Tropicibacter naphthalenivorans TaxID=441103 RepID=A0A0P1G673_9RHOB|nr:hypothetical protein [Tropicibacter naphthalenivorans]CUH77099.1 hypothetical protein TRN7648_01293 [Tropicibacter naphthalenivorans]SMC60738.1 hypothetical protein SAMN04488093_102325 [Tropicibacter naphthalenivorans]